MAQKDVPRKILQDKGQYTYPETKTWYSQGHEQESEFLCHSAMKIPSTCQG